MSFGIEEQGEKEGTRDIKQRLVMARLGLQGSNSIVSKE